MLVSLMSNLNTDLFLALALLTVKLSFGIVDERCDRLSKLVLECW